MEPNYIDNVFPYTNPYSGNVTFTGPDGLRNYRPHLVQDNLAVGIGTLSDEQTTSTAYILRPAPATPLTRPRTFMPGEIGWGIPSLCQCITPKNGTQIVLGDMRQLAEDRTTHQLLGAWYPPPEESTPLGADGYYKENIYSGRPSTANVRYMQTSGSSRAWRPHTSFPSRQNNNNNNKMHSDGSDDSLDRGWKD